MDNRKKLESDADLLLFALEETNDGWWDWNVKDNTFYLSPKYWSNFGYDPKTKNHLAEEWQEICHPEDIKTVQSILKEHFESHGEMLSHNRCVVFHFQEKESVGLIYSSIAIKSV